MLLEINIGLLIAVAIIASLLSVVLETKLYNRWISYVVFLFGVSAVLSTVSLLEGTWMILHGIPSQETLFQAIMTNFSLFLFLVATEILAYIAFRRLWKIGKSERR